MTSFLLFSCKDGGTTPELNNYEPYTETVTPLEFNNRININVKKGIELLNVIQHLSNRASATQSRFSTRYSNNVESYFDDFADHPAVRYIDSLWGNGLSHDAQPTILLYHSDPPELTQLITYSNYLLNRAYGEAPIQRMIALLRQFYNDSDFETFWNDHINFYTTMENQVKTALSDDDYISMLEDFYGETKNSYNIIPAPLSGHGYGPQVTENGLENVYNICGAPQRFNNDPYYIDHEYFLSLVFHEFSHSFVNPETEKHLAEIDATQSLFNPIRQTMTDMNYGSWATCVNEHLVRLSVACLMGQLEGAEKKASILQSEYDNGFIYIYELDEAITSYINARNTYPGYDDFYPKFIEVFSSLLNQ